MTILFWFDLELHGHCWEVLRSIVSVGWLVRSFVNIQLPATLAGGRSVGDQHRSGVAGTRRRLRHTSAFSSFARNLFYHIKHGRMFDRSCRVGRYVEIKLYFTASPTEIHTRNVSSVEWDHSILCVQPLAFARRSINAVSCRVTLCLG